MKHIHVLTNFTFGSFLTIAIPSPVTHGRVNKAGDAYGIDEVSGELHALSNAA